MPRRGFRKIARRRRRPNVKKAVRRYVNSAIRKNEREDAHYCYVSSVGYVNTTTPVVSLLSNIAQGDDVNNRTGNSCKAISRLSLNMTMYYNSLSVEPETFRYVVFQDRMQVPGTNPTPLQLFGTTLPTSYELYNWTNQASKRFAILKDETVSNITSIDGRIRVERKLRLDIPIKRFTYSGSGGTTTVSPGLYLMTWCPTEVTNGTNLAFQSRFAFDP